MSTSTVSVIGVDWSIAGEFEELKDWYRNAECDDKTEVIITIDGVSKKTTFAELERWFATLPETP